MPPSSTQIVISCPSPRPGRRLGRLGAALALAITLALHHPSAAQAREVTSGNVELRLQPEAFRDGIPQSFTVFLVNTSDRPVRLPQPTLDCSNARDGSIMLREHFVPLHTAASDGFGHGCVADSVNWPSILDRVKAWESLAPGQALSLASRQEVLPLLQPSVDPGTYEFWAVYEPPYLKPEDQQILRSAGIDFPHGTLTSTHITFTRRH